MHNLLVNYKPAAYQSIGRLIDSRMLSKPFGKSLLTMGGYFSWKAYEEE